ncbi:electron transfer flavoprotein subunit alpha/FixB family protein [Actinotalea sp. K2]|uniref:electron transfer flavoprotein subunit alpha/FixB family protein n=1 Tax=Actinotalea sp. K2 TaxID=2939438 RepID=UPI0020181E06|nr:electron transfer flavoprotein subunit alpha/FixB family protein [Actinotalea sp. K2]MCL3860480.1 electron transfer flavoprotein subunit alpha/FixB family protein [Actinotalea sp. K2]
MTISTAPADSTILVLVDHTGGTVRPPVLELLTLARSIGRAEALWIGDGVEPVLDTLAAHGASTVHRAPADARGLVPTVAGTVAAVVERTGAQVVLLSSTFENKEIAARVALATQAALVVDAAGVERVEGRLVTTQAAFAGTWTLRGEVTTDRAVVAVKPNAVPALAVDGAARPDVVEHPAVPTQAGPDVTLVERVERAASGRPELGEAQAVVVGGRGTNGDFSAVEDLADALGAAVGATRVATDEGWIGHEAQIGQTGVTVSPRLYVGAGVSGAVHHRGGMQSSGTIVAVNSDPESPIFEIADYGIVGDLFTVLPQAAAEIRRLRG